MLHLSDLPKEIFYDGILPYFSGQYNPFNHLICYCSETANQSYLKYIEYIRSFPPGKSSDNIIINFITKFPLEQCLDVIICHHPDLLFKYRTDHINNFLIIKEFIDMNKLSVGKILIIDDPDELVDIQTKALITNIFKLSIDKLYKPKTE